MDEVRVVGRAKVNLFLRVLGMRDDGYHEIESVMQTVELFDELRMSRAASTSVGFEWVDGLSGRAPAPPDLVEKAIGIFNHNVGGTQAAHVRVFKRIPIGAGLGGGSADAAAALRGVAALSGADVPDSLLLDFAGQVGSDVPFALTGGMALVRGRGEIVSPLDAPELWWVLAMPGIEISTQTAYERFDEGGHRASRNSADSIISALSSGDVAKVGAMLSNDLEAVAVEMHPELRQMKREMINAGALGAVVTGSGPTIAGLCGTEDEARRVAGKLSTSLRPKVARSSPLGAQLLGDRT